MDRKEATAALFYLLLQKTSLFSIVTLWFDFEYEIEYEYDFGISSKFCKSTLLLTRTYKEIKLLWQTLIWGSRNWFENSYLTQSDTCSPIYSLWASSMNYSEWSKLPENMWASDKATNKGGGKLLSMLLVLASPFAFWLLHNFVQLQQIESVLALQAIQSTGLITQGNQIISWKY